MMKSTQRDENAYRSIPFVALLSMTIGWLAPVLQVMGKNRLWAMPLSDGTSLVPVQGQPLFLKQDNAQDLYGACKTAVAGRGDKEFSLTTQVAVPVDQVLNFTQPAFGLRVKLSNSPLNWKYSRYDLQIGDAAVAQGRLMARSASMPVDLVMFGISNTGGQASVIRLATPRLTLTAASSGTVLGDVTDAETLNERDLNSLPPN
jgi:hypothetical protein